MSEEDAWTDVLKTAKEAVETRDLDDFRMAVQVYRKAVKEISYEQLERSFRTNDLGIFIIATEPREGETLDTHTLIDLSGKKDCKYKVGYFFKKTPRTSKLAEVWPASEEENLARLKDAGVPYERGIPKCLRCKGNLGTLQLSVLSLAQQKVLNARSVMKWVTPSRSALKQMLLLQIAETKVLATTGVNGVLKVERIPELEQEPRAGTLPGLRMLRALGAASQLLQLLLLRADGKN
ncbi:MAG: hypothetical protein Q9166_003699 [cf. Caloplaca sp. 2 TL-2023]